MKEQSCLRRYGCSWREKETDEDYWVEGWFTDITLKSFNISEWRFCIAKYDGVPYFLFIFWFVMFRFGKYGYWNWR